MKIIKKFPHVLLFDKDSLKHPVSNRPDNIESLLTGSPVVIKINGKEKFAGIISCSSNRSKTGLYYGDIALTDDFYYINTIEIIETRTLYNLQGFNFITGFTTVIKEKVD